MFGAVVNDDIHHHATAAAGASTRAVYFVCFDQPPLPARAPIPVKIVEGIFGMLVGMLLPLRVVHPDAVGRFVVLFLQRIEEVADDSFLRPIAKPPAQSED